MSRSRSRLTGLAAAQGLAALVLLGAAPLSAQDDRASGAAAEEAVQSALAAHYSALEKGDVESAGSRLTSDYFYVAPWGALELRSEHLARMRGAFASGSLRNYRVQIRDLRTGPAGEGGAWFRATVRETYLRESGRRARNAFAEDLLTTGVAVREQGSWRIRYLQQTWSEETLRRMVPILHAAQPVDPEEY